MKLLLLLNIMSQIPGPAHAEYVIYNFILLSALMQLD